MSRVKRKKTKREREDDQGAESKRRWERGRGEEALGVWQLVCRAGRGGCFRPRSRRVRVELWVTRVCDWWGLPDWHLFRC